MTTQASKRLMPADMQWLADAFAARFLSSPKSVAGPYTLDEDTCFGVGGYGRVIRGVSKTGEVVAIKEVSSKNQRPAAVNAEVATLRRVSNPPHPNIIGYRGFYTTTKKSADGHETFYIALEAALGGELFDKVLDRGMLGEEYSRSLFKQMLAGVQHMHAAGVAHRDLKLENVILDGDGTPKWVDFGLAHAHRPREDEPGYEPEMLKMFCGSKSYCPPEIMAGRAYDGFRADVWSLGVCLFAMVTGFFPLEEANGRDWRFPRLHRAQQRGESTTCKVFEFYSRPVHLSPTLVELLDRMLVIDPRGRPSLDEIAASPWLAEQPGTAIRHSMHAQTVRSEPALENISSGTSAATSRGSEASEGKTAELAVAMASRVVSLELNLDQIDLVHRCDGGSHSVDTSTGGDGSTSPGGGFACAGTGEQHIGVPALTRQVGRSAVCEA